MLLSWWCPFRSAEGNLPARRLFSTPHLFSLDLWLTYNIKYQYPFWLTISCFNMYLWEGCVAKLLARLLGTPAFWVRMLLYEPKCYHLELKISCSTKFYRVETEKNVWLSCDDIMWENKDNTPFLLFLKTSLTRLWPRRILEWRNFGCWHSDLAGVLEVKAYILAEA